jgi:hypothetical protein
MPKPHDRLKFLHSASQIHGDDYVYDLVDYVNSHTKVTIICHHHGEFTMTPANHIHSKQGCPSCRYSKQSATNLARYGGHPRQTQEVKTKQEATNLERYGYTNPFGSPLIRERIKSTNLEKYGTEHPWHCDKIRATNLEKYGSESSFGSALIQGRIRATNLKKYGVDNPRKSELVKETIKASQLKKYGTEYYNQQHMIDVLPLLHNSEWLFAQYITQSKTAIQISDELGIRDGTVGKYLKKAEIEIRTNFYVSYKQLQWLDSLEIPHLLQEWSIPETKYSADGYDPLTNTIYEFHGDYWHGNPDVFAPDIMNDVVGKTMGDLYNNTKAREEEILALGYNLVVMWETNFNKSRHLEMCPML